MKSNIYVEFYGEQVSQAELVEEVKKIWKDEGKKLEDLTDIKLYLKPEEDRVYYVLNDTELGSFLIDNRQNDF